MSSLQAALGLAQLQRVEQLVEKRGEIFMALGVPMGLQGNYFKL